MDLSDDTTFCQGSNMIFWLCATLIFTGVAVSWTARHSIDPKPMRHAGGVLLIAGLLVLGFALPATRVSLRNQAMVSVATTEQQ